MPLPSPFDYFGYSIFHSDASIEDSCCKVEHKKINFENEKIQSKEDEHTKLNDCERMKILIRPHLIG